jgi:hypothetical protein
MMNRLFSTASSQAEASVPTGSNPNSAITARVKIISMVAL